MFQGIYRVSAVKSKVERLCQSFETDCDEVDLSEHHPNVIANVLKLYLRQVTTPSTGFEFSGGPLAPTFTVEPPDVEL